MSTPLTIEIHKEGELIDTLVFDQGIIKIGRLSSAHLKLEDERVSRIHAVMEVVPDEGLFITDMGSAEGTYVNGERISKAPVSEGDEIVLGDTRLVVRLDSADRVPTVVISDVDAEDSSEIQGEEGSEGISGTEMTGEEPEKMPDPGSYPENTSSEQSGMEVQPEKQEEEFQVQEQQPSKDENAVPVAAGAAMGAGAIGHEPPVSPDETSPETGGGAEVPAGSYELPDNYQVSRYDVQGFIEGRVDPSPVPDSEHRFIELRFMWGELLLDVHHVKDHKPVTIGESRKCDFFLAGEDFPEPEFPLITYEGEYELNVTKGMDGVVRSGERTCTVDELIRSKGVQPHHNLYDTFSIRLTPEVRAAIQFGGITVLIRSVSPARPVVAPFFSQLNYGFLNTLIFSFFVHMAVLVTALNFPHDTRLREDDLFTTPNRFAKMILTPPEPPERNPLLDRLMKQDQGDAAEKHKDDEGDMGQKDLPDRDARTAPKAVDPTDQELVSQVFERLRGGDRGLSTVFDSSGLGGDIEGALGNLIGSVVGDAGGQGGLGLKGLGGGGGGLSGSTVGVGGIGTRGRGGFGEGGYGMGVSKLGKRRDADINISEGTPVIRGALDRELIRRVIHANRAQVRYCYERQLQVNPGIHGRIAVRFTIAANGTVSAASIDQNTMGNTEVANCLISRLRTWQFPEPKGGGIVIVTYPFVFTQAG